MRVVSAIQTVSALANGADPGDVIKDYAISTAASYLGGQLGGAVRTAHVIGSEKYAGNYFGGDVTTHTEPISVGKWNRVTHYNSGDQTFASVYGITDDGFVSLNKATARFFNSHIGRTTMTKLVNSGQELKIAETQRRGFRGGAYAINGKNEIYINPNYITGHKFRNMGWFKGYSHPPLDAVLAHEVGHATYGIIDEQLTVNSFENRYRGEMGYHLRGAYNDFISSY